MTQDTYTLEDAVENDLIKETDFWIKYHRANEVYRGKETGKKQLWSVISKVQRVKVPETERRRLSVIQNFGFRTQKDFREEYPKATHLKIRGNRIIPLTVETRAEISRYKDLQPGETIEVALVHVMDVVDLEFQVYVKGVYPMSPPHKRRLDIKGQKNVEMGMEAPHDMNNVSQFWDDVHDQLETRVLNEFIDELARMWDAAWAGDVDVDNYENLHHHEWFWSLEHSGTSTLPTNGNALRPDGAELKY